MPLIMSKTYNNESEYANKLKDPRWQKKRLEVLQRDEFTCQLCFDSESTLHVHHLSYEKGKDVWDYPLTNFITLCEPCHELETDIRFGLEKDLLRLLKTKGVMVRHLEGLIDDLSKLDVEQCRGVSMDFIFDAVGFLLKPDGSNKVIEIRDEIVEKYRKERKALNKKHSDNSKK